MQDRGMLLARNILRSSVSVIRGIMYDFGAPILFRVGERGRLLGLLLLRCHSNAKLSFKIAFEHIV